MSAQAQVASWVRRFEAAVTTAVPVLVIHLVLVFAISVTGPSLDLSLQRRYGMTWQQSYKVYVAVITSLPLAWVILYGVIAKATYGMRKRKIRFGNIDGAPIGRGRCLLRITVGIIIFPYRGSWR